MTLLGHGRTDSPSDVADGVFHEEHRVRRVHHGRSDGSTGSPDLIHRVIVIVAALSLLGPAFATWAGIIPLREAGLASIVLTAGSLAAVVGAAIVKSERSLRRIEVALVVLAGVALIAWTASVVVINPAYGTDEAAYEQFAAQLVLRGIDPYGRNLLSALREFQVPIQYATYTMSGGVVSTLGYPALPVLLAVPFVLMTHGVQSIPVADLASLVLAMLIGFFALPRRYRALSVVVVVGLPILFGYSIAGVNVTLALPFLVVVASGFTATGSGGTLRARGVAQAVCLGLAISVQQIAWFLLPFVLVAIWSARRRELDRRQSAAVLGRYAGIAGATFVIVNLPFIVLGPSSWLRGVLGPLVQHAIPYGQGLIDLPVFLGIGGGDLALYTLGALLLFAGLLLCFWRFFDILWRATFILPALVLFFPTRSLAEYWMTLILVWLVSLFAKSPRMTSRSDESNLVTKGSGRPGKLRGLVPLAALVPGCGVLAFAVASPAPLAMKVIGFRTDGQFQRIWELSVEVANHSDASLMPHFAANSIGQMTPFWHRRSGPLVLGPHKVAKYLLVAPNVGSMPGITQPFQLDAVTAKPESISVTGNVTAEPYTASIYQSFINRVEPPGHSAELTVQLRSPFGGRVHKAGVTVALGQIFYRESALVPADAEIDGESQGKSPVLAKTNATGEATFVVSDRFSQRRPIYFQAWVVSSSGYPFGYSEVVDILWSKRS